MYWVCSYNKSMQHLISILKHYCCSTIFFRLSQLSKDETSLKIAVMMEGQKKKQQQPQKQQQQQQKQQQHQHQPQQKQQQVNLFYSTQNMNQV